MQNFQFPEWLKSLGDARYDLPPADRECFYVGEQIAIEGDWTSGWSLSGSIKMSPNSPSELAVFAVGSATFDADENLTVWDIGLPETAVNLLPASETGVDYFYYNFLLVGPVTRPIIAGIFTVRGFITETA